jgi:probable HAF family extracellular repeat protein
MSTYIYTTVDVPGAANTVVFGVNNLDQIVGGSSPGHGFLDSGGTFTTIDPPGSTSIDYPANGLVSISPAAVGINDAGQIVGRYDIPGSTHGFLYSGGTYTTIDDPNGVGGVANGINNSGQIVGIYGDASGIAPRVPFERRELHHPRRSSSDNHNGRHCDQWLGPGRGVLFRQQRSRSRVPFEQRRLRHDRRSVWH